MTKTMMAMSDVLSVDCEFAVIIHFVSSEGTIA